MPPWTCNLCPKPAAIKDIQETLVKLGRAAKFVLKKGSTGKYRFNLVATNGQIIATSEAMRAKPVR